MPTGKRASMREGPLAALFRKTAHDAQDGPSMSEQPSSPTTSPGSSTGSGPGSAPERTPGSSPAPTPGSSPAPERAARPQPPARPAPPEAEEPRIPLPHERLRQAFSPDIPENVLERAAHPEAPPAPEEDVYAR